ncbi:hypothetical protein M2366_001550 [Aeromonas sp. BIGb0405]|uniref:hypothetical protein n=1 Tax=Aeromonas sp. BIGb0405 TaxID=2940592 RepID=UPI002168C385|nr:hypothetical protein [Aeromonas sp. BIGb0405]MCS3455483.1 hypothetical protein [Aeromonas sp. BIGb0405]
MQQPTLHVVPAATATASPRVQRLDEYIAQFHSELACLNELDSEVMTLRAQRKVLLERIPPAKARLEELRQGRINQLLGGAVSLELAREYRELCELVEDASEAQRLSERQEKRLAIPLQRTQVALNSAVSMVAGSYESYLDHKVMPGTLNALGKQLAPLAALTHAKASIMGNEGALRWAQNELARALKGAMVGEQVELDGDKPAARAVLATPTRSKCPDLIALCDSPGKRQCLLRELDE